VKYNIFKIPTFQLKRIFMLAFVLTSGLLAVSARSAKTNNAAVVSNTQLAKEILADPTLRDVHHMAQDLLKSGLNAGNNYQSVWIRDMNTFIEVALEVNPPQRFRKALLTFFKFQGADGDIVDGYKTLDPAQVKSAYRVSPLATNLMAFKNTVEVDQESSLVQAVFKYVTITHDKTILDERVAGIPVRKRLAMALQYVLSEHFDKKHGLVWGATRADWGDVQPEDSPGVLLDAKSHRALSIYDNAMLVIALNDCLQLLGENAPKAARWKPIRDQLKRNIRKYLWDAKKQKFIPHVYLAGPPFPKGFDENTIYFNGGTAVAIEAGLITRKEVAHVLGRMEANVRLAGAATIGLTLYPPYPQGFFKNPGMRAPYHYQNGGDWTWFGGRMIQALVEQGYIAEAYRDLRPMVERVKRTGDFNEWWSRDNQPVGSRHFRGSAGVLGQAIEMLQAWARQQQQPNSDNNAENGGSGGARTRPKSNRYKPQTTSPSQIDSQERVELREIASAWPRLTDPLKAAVLALVRAARGNGVRNEGE
jgi:Amylo-alpha-1,6-glucosidase